MIYLIILQSQARLEMKIIDQKLLLKQQEKGKYTTDNNNIVNKEDTSSNISKPIPFGNKNDRSEDDAEAARKKENI